MSSLSSLWQRKREKNKAGRGIGEDEPTQIGGQSKEQVGVRRILMHASYFHNQDALMLVLTSAQSLSERITASSISTRLHRTSITQWS
jgi:hypothetical protein